MAFSISDLSSDLAERITANIKKNKAKSKDSKLEQFAECDVKKCVNYNEEGHCSYETCMIDLDDPKAASMITKICQFCGNKFATCISTMPIQLCPACREKALESRGHPHKCIFCGRNIDDNPSIFFACCSTCFDKLKEVTSGSVDAMEQAFYRPHCYDCPRD